MFAFLDTPFDPEYPVYTRANAGEILPDPVTPLAWSVAGPGFEEGFRIAFCDSFGLLPRPGPDRPYQVVGRMAARLHLNLSVIRTTAQRLPGTSAAIVDVQYFGDAATSGLPSHEASTRDRRYRLKAPPQVGRTLAGLGRRVDRDRQRIDELAGEVDAAIAGRPGPSGGEGDAPPTDPGGREPAGAAELVRLIRRCADDFATALGTHVTARGLTSPLLEQAVAALGRAGIAVDESLRYVADIPELESAKPSRALAAIAGTIVAGSPLAEVVGRGSLAAIASSDAAGAADVHARLTEFLATYGHRGVSEFDPTRLVWEQRPDDVVVLLSRLGHHGVPHPEPPTVDPGRIARPIVAAARSAMARAERTKDTTMRATNLLRRLLLRLRDVLGDAIDASSFTMYTLDELEGIANDGSGPAPAELARRADDFARASAVEPAEWSDGALRVIGDPDAPSATAPGDRDGAGGSGDAGETGETGDTALSGIAGSPGVVRGTARVLVDPYGDFADGDVLVAHMTDTAWTPLFVAASGVITDVGGVLSHATIVARDLGIPAVVNTKRATTVLRSGDLVEIDGTAGTVTVLERA